MNILDMPNNRSKKILRSTMIALLSEKPFSTITIQNICDRAELTRPTFYRYYEDKEALLNELADDFFSGFRERIVHVQSEGKEKFVEHIRTGCHPGFVEYFRYFRENKQVMDALLTVGSGVDMTARFVETLTGVDDIAYTEHLAKNNAIPMRRELGIQALTDSYLQWAKEGMVVSDEVMATTVTAFWAGSIFPTGQPDTEQL